MEQVWAELGEGCGQTRDLPLKGSPGRGIRLGA